VIYGSVCSGIEAASVAWHPLGWRAAFLSEIEPFPRAVLAHRFPDVPLHGDFTTIEAGQYEPVDLLVGGTPCQSFSIAGLRGGLADDRGNLALEYLRLADRLRPRWLVWENVPGVLSSNGGRDFGAILGGMVELGYGFAYRVLDAQHLGVPQRRRRVFVVGYFGDWRRAAAVLFERHSLQGHPPPRREKGKDVAPTISARPTGGGGLGTDFDLDDGLIASTGNVAHCLNAGGMGRQDYETETLITHALRAEGFDASEDGTGRGTPLVPVAYAIQERAVSENPNAGPDGAGYRTDGMAYTLEARTVPQAIAFSSKDHGADAGETSPTLRAGGHSKSHANAVVPAAVAFDLRGREGGAQFEGPHDSANIRAASGGSSRSYVASTAVRRLTPMECERLQGFPDQWTLVPHRGKPAADGPRYKALGNSMAVPVMAWIGQRIAAVEAILEAEGLAA
jgi:DNA (cytosine-5)-methyltransferase 1